MIYYEMFILASGYLWSRQSSSPAIDANNIIFHCHFTA